MKTKLCTMIHHFGTMNPIPIARIYKLCDIKRAANRLKMPFAAPVNKNVGLRDPQFDLNQNLINLFFVQLPYWQVWFDVEPGSGKWWDAKKPHPFPNEALYWIKRE